MTEAEFVSRFQREPTGSWTCIDTIRIEGPNGPLFIRPGQSFSPGMLLFGIDLARELDRMAAVHRAASKLAAQGFDAMRKTICEKEPELVDEPLAGQRRVRAQA